MLPRGEAKETILDIGEALLQQVGFNGFSYKHIADKVGIKPAAVHYHFPTKEDLGVAMIQRLRERFTAWTRQIESKGPVQQLDAFFELYAEFKRGDKACHVGILEAEFHAIPARLRETTRAYSTEIYHWLCGVMSRGRERGVFSYEGKPEDRALVVAATVQGALQIARAYGPKAFDHAVAQLKKEMKS